MGELEHEIHMGNDENRNREGVQFVLIEKEKCQKRETKEENNRIENKMEERQIPLNLYKE